MSRWVPRIRRDVFLLVLASLAVPRAAAAHDEYLASLVRKSRVDRLADSATWHALLHYRPMWYGGWRSEADGPGFFLAGPAGKIDPRRELEATLAAFRAKPGPSDPARPEETQPAQCRFPARWTYLKKALGIDTGRFVDHPCPLFAPWRQGISAQTVSLVYAAAYLNSPASMYGHTFLRLSRATGEGNPLLDYIINFAADVDTQSGLAYVIKGLVGGFRGKFFTMPYYFKIQEYSHMESRDLWEYELALGPEQVERLVAHAWEMRTTHFEYFFISENCSYFLLGLLDAAEPSLRLSERFKGYVIPSDTIRALFEVPGLVRNVAPRPSLHATMMTRKEGLDGAGAKVADDLATKGKEAAAQIAPLPALHQAAILDAAYDRLRYKEGGKEPPSDRFARTERDLLVLRGRTGVPAHRLVVEPGVDAPERGHRTFRLGLGGGVRDRPGNGLGGFQELEVRFAVHDHLDPPRGYVGDAVLEMLRLRFRFDDADRSFSLARGDAINIVSPAPLDSWAPKLSWAARLGGEQQHALGCAGWSCLAGTGSAGAGLATRLARRLLVYGLVEGETSAGPALRDGYRLGAGGSLATVLRLGSWWHTRVAGRYLYNFLGDRRRHVAVSAAQAWDLGSRVQLRLTGELAGRYREGRLEAVAYF